MSLSNTAVPKYYREFRDSVLRGDIPVCNEISLEMNRIDSLIANPAFYYDSEAIDGFIAFCESELCLRNGSPVELLPTFKLWAEQALSWFYFDETTVFVPGKRSPGKYINKIVKKRLINKQFLVISRSAAKSMYLSFLQAYFLIVDPQTTKQVTTAPTTYQAEEVLNPIKTAIALRRGPVIQFLTEGNIQNTTGDRALRQKLASTKKGIENFLTNSLIEIKPMSISKFQGLNVKIVTIDEWLSCDIKEDVVGAAEQGAAKYANYLVVAASSEGTVRNGVGDSIKMELMSILKGEYQNPHVSIWYYKLDDIEEVGKPEMWLKANPNLGATVSYETYQLEVERAEKVPSAKNDILAKRFNIPAEGFTLFFTYEETMPSKKRYDFWALPCSLGADLSQGDDFCAFTFLFPLRHEEFGVSTRCYITEVTMSKLPIAMRYKYETFMEDGSLVVMPGTVLDLTIVYDDLDKFITNKNYDVRSFGYDPYNAKEFVETWTADNGPYGVEKVIQGSRTESVPLGEIKHLVEEEKLKFNQPLFSWSMGNCVVLVDTNGNRKLYKARRDLKIDPVSALMDAYVAFKAHKDLFE